MTILTSVALTLAVAIPLLLAGNLWYVVQYSLAGIPLALALLLGTPRSLPRGGRAAAMVFLLVSFPLAIWTAQLPASVAWVRLFGRSGGGGLWLHDVNAESLYVGLGVAAVMAAAAVAVALRIQTGLMLWGSFLLGALGTCIGIAAVYIVFRPGTLNGGVVQSIALAVWLAVLSAEWAVGLRAAQVTQV